MGETFVISCLLHEDVKQTQHELCVVCLRRFRLKVPKREIFDRSDFPDFYTIKSSCVGDSVVKILTCYFNF